MRADRLLSLIMLLQTRGRMTAQALADELEVSVRTIYRDVDALSAAGIPVYADPGPGGGCALLDSYQTNLTGLTEDEVRALFMVTIPAFLSDLGVGRELKTALLKLSAALPAERRRDEAWVRQRVYLDWIGGFDPGEPVPHLQVMQQAVWEDRRLHLAYRLHNGPQPLDFERVVDPYGLVAKAGVWHLVCAAGGRVRVFRVSGVLDARLASEHFRRPADFDLAAFWSAWCAEHQRHRARYPVAVRVAPALLPELPLHLGEPIHGRVAAAGPPDAEGWVTLVLSFDSLESARSRLLSLGGAAEVLEPLPLRLSLADLAAQIVTRYQCPAVAQPAPDTGSRPFGLS